jgi:hypothetical protein
MTSRIEIEGIHGVHVSSPQPEQHGAAGFGSPPFTRHTKCTSQERQE